MKKNIFIITCLLLSFSWVMAQSPGGVSAGLQLWLKADAGINSSGNNITSWQDQSANAFLPNVINSPQTGSTINFNNVVSIAGIDVTGGYFRIPNTAPNFANLNVATSNSQTELFVTAKNSRNNYSSIVAKNNGGNWDGINLATVNNTIYGYNVSDWFGNGGTTSAQQTVNNSNPFFIFNGNNTLTGTSNVNRLSVNGNSYTTNNSPFINPNPYDFTIGNNSAGGTQYGMEGLIGEVIYYNRNLTINEVNRINSYLAVKNGITLPLDYIASNGSTTIWNNSSNSGYNNNIFGIARDDSSGLHQKQAISLNSSQKLIIGAESSLFDNNASNTNSLTNEQFLMVGDNGLAQSLSVSLNFNAPGGEVNNHFASIWKVQNTNNVGTVTIAWPVGVENLHLVRSTDATFTSTDEFIPMTGVTTVNGVDYNTATITFNDGNYFTFAGFATAPGGVLADIKAWYSADSFSQTDNTEVLTLTDLTGNGYNLVQHTGGAASNAPTYKVNSMNFNPSISFDGNFDAFFYNSRFFPSTGNGSMIFATSTNETNAWRILSDIGLYDPNVGINLNSGAARGFLYHDPGQQFTSTYNTSFAVPLSVPFIGNYGFTYSPIGGSGGRTLARMNGNSFSLSQSNFTNIGLDLGGRLTLGALGDNGAYWWNGLISEAIYYDRDLTDEERQRIDTYLAIKYGVTLDQSLNYLSSNGSVVWDSSTNALYNNNIFGIAQDLLGKLSQKVSSSVNPTAAGKLTVATTNNFTADNKDTSRTALSDNQYQIFGDNNNTSITVASIPSCPALAPVPDPKMINKKWLAQEKGVTVGAVYLEIDLSAYVANINSNYFMVVSQNEDLSNFTLIEPIEINGNKAVFYHDFSDGDYFSFGGYLGAPDCEVCEGKKQTYTTNSNWNANTNTQSLTIGQDSEGNNLAANASIVYTGAVEYFNGYFPANWGSYFGKTIGRYDNLTGSANNTVYKVNFSKNGTAVAAKLNFDIYNIINYYGSSHVVTVIGKCNGNTVLPTLRSKQSSGNTYTISGNVATGTSYGWFGQNTAVNVSFDVAVEEVEIIWHINRNIPYYLYTLISVTPMSFTCNVPQEPNSDNIYVLQSYKNENVEACNEAEMLVEIQNKNCNPRKLSDFTNQLDPGIEFIEGTYNPINMPSGWPTPTLSADKRTLTFDLGGNPDAMVIPSASTAFTYTIGVKVSDQNIASNTTFESQSTYTVSVDPPAGEASGGTGEIRLSDDYSGLSGLQKTQLNIIAAQPVALPEMTITSNVPAGTCGEITYTVEFNNTSGNAISDVIFESKMEETQLLVANSVTGLSSFGTPTIFPTNYENAPALLMNGLTIPNGISSFSFTMNSTLFSDDPSNEFTIYRDPAVDACAFSNKSTKYYPDNNCISCEGGKQILYHGAAWSGNSSLTNVSKDLNGTAPNSGALTSEVSVDYQNGATEWLPTIFPRPYGSWVELSRYDNDTNGKVVYSIDLKDKSTNDAISAKASFQITGINRLSGQSDVIKIVGYCGATVVNPKLNYGYNSGIESLNNLYRRFEIDQANALATGTKPYYDFTSFDILNVEFESTVDRIVVEWEIQRTPQRRTLDFLYISPINFTCNAPLEPNADNVHVTASYLNDALPTCEEATIKLKVYNQNCDSKIIDITNSLPSDLEYVADSYVGLTNEAPTYSGQSFSLSNLTVPTGNSYIYVKVRATNAAASGNYATQFTYTVSGGGSHLSDDESGQNGLQTTKIDYTASAETPKPTLVKSVDKCFRTTTDGNGTELTYTITVNNPTATDITNVELLELLDGSQKFVASSLNNPFGGVPNDYATDENYLNITGMTIPANTVDGIITFKVLTYDTNADFSNVVTMDLDPSNECAISNRVTSNELMVLLCTFCTENPNTTTATEFSLTGISTYSERQAGWPNNVANGFLTLESANKGFVITRLTTTQRDALSPIEGMLIYNTTLNKFQLYKGAANGGWVTLERGCNN